MRYVDGWCRPEQRTAGFDTESSTEPLPAGLGEECHRDEDCEGYDADYCAIDMSTSQGVCTIKDCLTAPDDCPSGLRCCDLPSHISYPNMCVSAEAYTYLIDLLGSCTGDPK